MKPSTNLLAQVLPSLSDGSPIYIVTHERPDADAVGCQAAFARYLRNLRLPAFALRTDIISETLQSFLNDIPCCSLQDLNPKAHYVAVDAGTPSRVAEAVRAYLFALVLDHHPELPNIRWGTRRLVRPDQSSACEVLLELLEAHGYAFDDPVINNALYLGLIGDTGNFCNTNTTSDTFRHAEHLTRAGVRPHAVVQRLYKSQTLQQWRLYEIFLNRVQLYTDGAVVLSTLTEADYEATRTCRTDTEGFVNRLLLLKTAKIAAFVEQTGALVKVSLRSVDTTFPVNTVAEQRNGGGHVCAASFKCEPAVFSQQELVQQLMAILPQNTATEKK